MKFEFQTATRIVFGAGALREVVPQWREFGFKPFIVSGRDPQRAELLTNLLALRSGESVGQFKVVGEPSIGLSETARMARETGCDFVISIGGGSVVDAGKAIASLMTNPGDDLDYVEVVGRGKAITEPPVPFIAIPTTAGTGAEVTRNAVLSVPEQRVKVSLRSPLMLPRLAIVDPELTYDLPPALTASTGLDALTQLIEPYVSCRANPMTDALCVEGIRRAARSLRRAVENGHDKAAREDMALASLFSGMALANAGLGAVHGFAAPIGGMFDAPHGAVCAVLLPHVMHANLRALEARAPRHDALGRYRDVARLLTGRTSATADDSVQWAEQLVSHLMLPRLGSYAIKLEHATELAAKAAQASSMKGNPIALTADELVAILRAAL